MVDVIIASVNISEQEREYKLVTESVAVADLTPFGNLQPPPSTFNHYQPSSMTVKHNQEPPTFN